MNDGITRFSRSHPCPVCGGGDDDRRGQGERCFGFLSSDKDWVHCSREDHAGRAQFEAKTATYLHRARGKCPCGEEHAPGEEAPRPPKKPVIDKVYRYRDADGQVVHETVRYKDKSFRQRRPAEGGGHAWDLKGIEPILYNLPAILAADPEAAVWICEGEKDADRLIELGALATTSPMGAGKWKDAYAETLKGRHCYVLADNDVPGRAHALAVARSLHGKAASVRVMELPGLPEKGDVSDWLDAGGEVPGLWELAEEAAVWTPEAAPPEPASASNGNGKANGNGHYDFAGMSLEELGLVTVADIHPANVNWLWEYRLARGEMAIVAGEGGLGKSMFLMACAAAVSRGGPWPAGCGQAPLGTVIVVSAEDHPDTTIRPRLQAMGADLGRVVICKARAVVDRDGQRSVHPMSLQDHSYWRAVFDRYPDTALFIVDPIPSYLGRGINDRQNNEIRAVLEPFIDEVIRPRKICFYCNTHLSKTVDARSPVQRITGSIAYANIPRNVHIIVRDPDDHGRRFFSQAKCNNGPDDLPAIGYRIEKRQIDGVAGDAVETAIAVFEGQLHQGFSLYDAMNGGNGRRGPKPIKSSKLAEWLWERLSGAGQVLVSALVDEAREAGLLASPTDKDAKPSISPLYNAAERVAFLHAGYEVETEVVKGGFSGKDRKAWRLVALNPAAPAPAGEGDEDDPDDDEGDDEPIF